MSTKFEHWASISPKDLHLFPVSWPLRKVEHLIGCSVLIALAFRPISFRGSSDMSASTGLKVACFIKHQASIRALDEVSGVSMPVWSGCQATAREHLVTLFTE